MNRILSWNVESREAPIRFLDDNRATNRSRAFRKPTITVILDPTKERVSYALLWQVHNLRSGSRMSQEPLTRINRTTRVRIPGEVHGPHRSGEARGVIGGCFLLFRPIAYLDFFAL